VSKIWCETPEQGEFCGNLDITALGGAGFASQRTLGVQHFDLSWYSGIALRVIVSDGKKYTIVLKDEASPERDDRLGKSTISWEHDFTCEKGEVFIRWGDFHPTFQGKARLDAPPLDVTDVKRIHIMMRRFATPGLSRVGG